jgi:hypothetical protein
VAGALMNAPFGEPRLDVLLLVELVLVVLEEVFVDELVLEEVLEEVLEDVLELVVGVGAVLAVVLLVELVEVLLEVLVDGAGQVQSDWQTSAPVGLPGGHVMLPGGSHSSPASSMPLPHGLVVVVVEVLVVVTDVAVVEGTVVVVVVVTAHDPQQSGSASTMPSSSRQRSADFSMSHFGARGQSRNPVQKREGSFVQIEVRVSQAAKRGSAHATAPDRPHTDRAAQLTIRPRHALGARSFATCATHST